MFVLLAFIFRVVLTTYIKISNYVKLFQPIIDLIRSDWKSERGYQIFLAVICK